MGPVLCGGSADVIADSAQQAFQERETRHVEGPGRPVKRWKERRVSLLLK